jgi:chorismate-pyruvate lyase
MRVGNQTNTVPSSGTERFDPLKEVLMAQFAKPAELGPVNLRALSPLQRALLVIDGTVTTFLEVYTLEPVDLRHLHRMNTNLQEKNEWLEAESGSEIELREVLIQGRQSHLLYVYAVASVVLERLPEEARTRLAAPGGSLGRVLNELQLETRREILWYGREHNHQLPNSVRELYDGSFLCRTYRIIAGGLPIALIHEKFPTSIANVSSFD